MRQLDSDTLGESNIKKTLEECIGRCRRSVVKLDDITISLRKMIDRSRELTDELAILDNFDNPYPERRRSILSEMDNISEEKRQMESELEEYKGQLKNGNDLIKVIKNFVSEHNINDETVTEYLSTLENVLKDAKN